MNLAERTATPDGPQPAELSAFLGEKKVLVVDDDPDIRRLVSMMLERHEIASVCVGTADDAMQILTEYPEGIGLVLLDLSIPNSSETAPLDRIKRRLPSIPIVVITGLPLSDVRIDPAYKDSVDFLRKPFHPAALYEALGKRRTRRDSGGRKLKKSRESGSRNRQKEKGDGSDPPPYSSWH